MWRLFITLSLYFLIANCAFPTYINKCDRQDPNFNECLKIQANILMSQVANGDPNLGLPNINSVPLPRILLLPDKEFSIELKNCLGYGLKDLVVLNIEMNSNPQILKFNSYVRNDVPRWECNYVAKGKILNKYFDETGNIKMIFINPALEYSAEYETIQINNTCYYQVINDVFSFTVDKITYELSKPGYNDDPQVKKLSKIINEENGNFQKEFYPSVRITVSRIFSQMINLIFRAIPVSELSLP